MTEGNQDKFERLIADHAGIIRKVATTYCRDATDRTDLAQDILVQLWTAWPRYDPNRPFTTWMYQIAINVAISRVRGSYRRAARFEPLTDNHHAIAAPAFDHETNSELEVLSGIIADFDPLNRALLLLYLDERSHREIAEILGIGESNVGTKLNRLKQRIRSRLA